MKEDPLVVGAWSHVASAYRDVWSPRFRPFLEDALAGFSPGPGPLAVVGCGPGDEAIALATRYPERSVLATDPSEEMLTLLGVRLAAAPVLNLEVRLGSAVDLPLQASALGGVFSSFTLQLLPDRAAALRAWAQALGPDGTITAVFWPRQPEECAWGRLGRAVLSVTGTPRPDWEADLRQDLSGLGLRLLRDVDIVHPIEHASPEEAWEHLREACSLQVLLRRVGEEHTNAVRALWLADHGLEQRSGSWIHWATARAWTLQPG